MIDRFGNRIFVGWPEHHILYLEAALSLPLKEHTGAFQDIAEMTGRSLESVRSKAYAITAASLEVKLKTEDAARKVRDAQQARRHRLYLDNYKALTSQITPPSKAQLMGRRA